MPSLSTVVETSVTIMCGVEPPKNGGDFLPQVLGLVAYAALIAYLILHPCLGKKN